MVQVLYMVNGSLVLNSTPPMMPFYSQLVSLRILNYQCKKAKIPIWMSREGSCLFAVRPLTLGRHGTYQGQTHPTGVAF